MQSQPNLGGKVRLGETHCDFCGAPRPPFDDEGYCRSCHKSVRRAALDTAVASLEILDGALEAALDGNVHADDVRALFERHLDGQAGARWTLDQLHTELRALYDEERAMEGAI